MGNHPPRPILALALALCLSCGGEEMASPETTAQAPMAVINRPPILVVPGIFPSAPRSDESLSLTVRARDPDGDPIQIEVEWYRGDNLFRRGPALTLAASLLSRGDLVRAVVHASDGKRQVTVKTASVRIRNQLPRITSLKVLPEEATTQERLLAEVKTLDADGDQVTLRYRWLLNGKEVEGASLIYLEAGVARRGDTVVVEVTPDDSYERGSALRSAPLHIGNAAPEINSRPTYQLSGSHTYRYRVRASDPDNDVPLRFRLHEGPPGMKIDLVSGLVSWRVPDDANGKYAVALSVSDPHGGERRQSYVLELSWESTPASSPN